MGDQAQRAEEFGEGRDGISKDHPCPGKKASGDSALVVLRLQQDTGDGAIDKEEKFIHSSGDMQSNDVMVHIANLTASGIPSGHVWEAVKGTGGGAYLEKVGPWECFEGGGGGSHPGPPGFSVL